MSFDIVSYAMGAKAGGGGGGGVTVEPLSVSENGTYTAPSGKAYSPVTVAVPNPNSIETIEGTLANPWGNKDSAELIEEFYSLNASVTILADASAIGFGSFTLKPTLSDNMWFTAATISNPEQNPEQNPEWTCVGALYSKRSGGLRYVYAFINGRTSDLSSYASMVSTTMTIIHHPLPTGG